MKTKNKSFKRLFAFLVALVMVTALVPSVIFAADPTFPDVDPNGWAYEHIESLYAQGIIVGFPDGEFKPDENLTRQQAAKMIALGAGYDDHDGTGSKLIDVANLSWGREQIWALEADEVVKGFGTSNEFRPRVNITRGHVAKMVALAFGIEEGDEEYELTDISGVDNEEYIRLLASNGIVSGFRNSTEFRPDELVTRGQFSKMVDLALKWEPVPVPFEVLEVKAINAQEIQVKYSKDVLLNSSTNGALNLSNYAITVNQLRAGDPVMYGFGYAGALVESITQKVGTKDTVILRLKSSLFPWVGGYPLYLDNGDAYSVDVAEGVLSKSGERLNAYVETQKTFADRTAPVLLGAEVGSNGKLVLTFDEPIYTRNWGYPLSERFKVTVNEEEVLMTADSGAQKYTVTSDGELDGAIDSSGNLKEGVKFDIRVYNARDFVNNNGNGGNKLTFATTSYTTPTAPKPEAPKVIGIEALDFNSFLVIFNREVDAADVEVYKGTTEFHDQNEGPATAHTVSGEVVGYAIQVDLPVSVTSNTGGITYLYAEGATSTQVDITVKDFYVGSELNEDPYNSTITLERDALLPAAKGEAFNSIENAYLSVALNRTVSVLDLDKITVHDKDGVPRTISESSSCLIDDGKTLKISLLHLFWDADQLEELAPFTVHFAAGALTVDTDLVDVVSDKYVKDDAEYEVYDATNSLVSVVHSTRVLKTPPPPAAPEFLAVEAVRYVTADNNVIRVFYDEDMGPSAAVLANYSLDGDAFPEGTNITMEGFDRIVIITLPVGSLAKDIQRTLVISDDVRTAKGSFVVKNIATKEVYTSQLLQLYKNVAPTLEKAEFVKPASGTHTKQIKLTFSEGLTQDTSGLWLYEGFKVTQGNSVLELHNSGSTLALDGKTLVITLVEEVHLASTTVKVTTIAPTPLYADRAISQYLVAGTTVSVG